MRASLRAATVAVAIVSAHVGCAPATSGSPGAHGPKVAATLRADGTVADDHSLCEARTRKDVELSETAGTGSMQPNVRRVYKVFGTGADRRKILICREVDTNLDGLKDNVRTFSDEGQSKEERADANFDGKVDTWNHFAKGRLAEVRLDKNFDGQEDEWKVYLEGKLSRIKRDSDFDGKVDIWEMYRKGRLERMGVDLDRDERVDRWDHDTEWRRKVEENARREERETEERERDAAAKREREGEDAEKPQGGGDAGADEKKRDDRAAKPDAGKDTKKDADAAPPKDNE